MIKQLIMINKDFVLLVRSRIKSKKRFVCIIFHMRGKYDKNAIDYYQQTLDIACEIKDQKLEGICSNAIGVAYIYLGQYDKAIDYYQKGLGIAREIKDEEQQEVWLYAIGKAYDNCGQYDKAIEYYQQGLDIAHEIKDQKEQGFFLT